MKNIIGVAVFIIALFVVFSFLNSDADNNEVVDNENITNTEASQENSNENGESLERPAENELAGTYTQYDGNLSQYEGKDIVLFFKADWCPSCRILDEDIKSKLSGIPEDVVLLELDYDEETELKKKYGVTTQHTMVQVDIEGELIKKWSGGNRLEDIVSQIN